MYKNREFPKVSINEYYNYKSMISNSSNLKLKLIEIMEMDRIGSDHIRLLCMKFLGNGTESINDY